MIQINNTIGTKSLFLNVFKRVVGNSVSTTQYTHESLHTRLLSDRYELYVTNQLTSAVSSVYLTFVSSNSRGAYFTFEFNTQALEKLQLSELDIHIRGVQYECEINLNSRQDKCVRFRFI